MKSSSQPRHPLSPSAQRPGWQTGWALAAGLLLLGMGPLACDSIPQQGDCDPGYLEVSGRCELAVGQDCSSNSDCLARLCVENPQGGSFCTIACQQHLQCPTGFFCTLDGDQRCYPGPRPPGCQSDADCPACQSCEQERCQALPGCRVCAADSDCGACERCEASACIQVAGCRLCQLDTECETCEACSASGRCERLSGCVLCNVDANCPGCFRCERGACMPLEGCGQDPCFNDLDCPQRTRCLFDVTQALNVCLPIGLTFGQDCLRGSDPTCAEGICLHDPTGTSATCSRPCDSDADCPDATRCEPDDACLWACRTPAGLPPGLACQSDADCPIDRVCGLVAAPSQSAWQTRCVAPLACAADNGQDCSAGTDGRCVTGICSALGSCTPICASHADCPLDTFCVQLELPLPDGGPSAAFFGCATADQARFGIGEPCPGGDAQCNSAQCDPGGPLGPEPLCTGPCIPGAAQCPDGFNCAAAQADPAQTTCQAALPAGECEADRDCTAPQVCRLDATSAAPICAPAEPGGAMPPGDCTAAAECAHGLCLPEGRCAAPCATADDCAAGLWCDLRTVVRTDGAPAWARLCTVDPGSLAACRHAADCAPGEVCRPERNARGTGLDGRCGPAGSGADLGADCQSPAGCSEGVCTQAGTCTAICEADEDCPDGYSCQAVPVPFAGVVFSLTVCAIEARGLGQPCPLGPPNCLSALCHQPADGAAYCTAACVSDPDCAEGAGMLCIDEGQAGLCRFP